MRRLFTTALLVTAPLAAQVPFDHLVLAFRTTTVANAGLQILDPDTGVVTVLYPNTGSQTSNGSTTVTMDPTAPGVLYSTQLLSTSIAAVLPVLTLTGNRWSRGNLQVQIGSPPHRLRWAPGFGMLLLHRMGTTNRMWLRNMTSNTLTSQPTQGLLPANSTDVAFLNGKAYASSEGTGTPGIGTLVEWDLALNTDRVVGASYPPLTALAVFAGQLLAGDRNGDLHVIDPVSGGTTLLVSTGLGRIQAIAVDSASRPWLLVDDGLGNFGVFGLGNLTQPVFTSTLPISDLVAADAPAPTMLQFGMGCPGGMASVLPSFAFGQMPALGTAWTVNLSAGTPNSGAFLLLGSSRTMGAYGPIPQDLGWLGMPGCQQYTDVLGSGLTFTDAIGAAGYTVPLPANPALTGLQVPMQWLVFSPGANALGALTSNGAEAFLR